MGARMKCHQGFSLFEAILALAIAAGMFVVANGIDRILLRPVRQDSLAWFQAVTVLEQPHRYRIRRVLPTELQLWDTQSTPSNKAISIWRDNHNILRLTNEQKQGYDPLLKRVTEVKWTEVDRRGLVRLTLKQEGLPWHSTILDLRGSRDS